MSFASGLYNTIFRRNSVFVGSIFFTAFFTDIAFNKGVDNYWNYVNRGKLWKDIRDKYVKEGDDEEDDE